MSDQLRLHATIPGRNIHLRPDVHRLPQRIPRTKEFTGDSCPQNHTVVALLQIDIRDESPIPGGPFIHDGHVRGHSLQLDVVSTLLAGHHGIVQRDPGAESCRFRDLAPDVFDLPQTKLWLTTLAKVVGPISLHFDLVQAAPLHHPTHGGSVHPIDDRQDHHDRHHPEDDPHDGDDTAHLTGPDIGKADVQGFNYRDRHW